MMKFLIIFYSVIAVIGLAILGFAPMADAARRNGLTALTLVSFTVFLITMSQ